jgi:hypothetical protein
MSNANKHRLVIDKEYIESHLGKKITQSQANHIISKIGDNDGLWDILHESIDNASEAYEFVAENFIEEVFEIAFGDNAINRDFSFQEVLAVLKEDSDKVAEMESEANNV